jgi:hypothetical protein
MGLDTATANGRLMLNVLGSVAQFEREVMLERQREGIAKARGVAASRPTFPTRIPRSIFLGDVVAFLRLFRCWEFSLSVGGGPQATTSPSSASFRRDTAETLCAESV